MPWVDLHSKADYASIYYTTNAPHCNVGGFNAAKPTVVILHPVFLDSTWLDLQLGDSRFNKHYNLIAFDMRSCGKSFCRPSGRHDSWVEAADLAFCFQKLHLPPSHLLCLEGTSIYCALRFAILFSEFCLSLTLVNVPAPVELKWIYKNIDELVHATCFADEPERFEQAAFECIEFLFGPDSDPDLMDELLVFWETTHPPSKRHRSAESTSVYINRTPLSAEACALITQPVLIIQGEKNELCQMKYAERLVKQLTGVTDGAILYEIKGGTSMVSVVLGHASILNNVFHKFLTRLPHHRSDLVPSNISIRDRMQAALEKLSQIMDNPEVAYLDPLCSLSFCSLAPEVIKVQSEILNHYMKNINLALTPVPPEIRPLRKFSQRERQEWSYQDKGRASVNSNYSTVLPERVKQESERGGKASSRSESQQSHTTDGFFRSAFSAAAAEKRNGITKGAPSKVSLNTTSSALQRR